jgi:hypothetical protein
MVDGHVWPSVWPDRVSGMALTHCGHVDYELVWSTAPELFSRRAQVGAPPLRQLWAAKHALAELGFALAFDVQFEVVDGEPALAVYGAGVTGSLTARAWREVAPMLTTCTSYVHEPREDVDPARGVMRPERPAVRGKYPMPSPVRPELWEAGDVSHTWWRYPFFGTLRADCACVAHTRQATEIRFGPSGRTSA